MYFNSNFTGTGYVEKMLTVLKNVNIVVSFTTIFFYFSISSFVSSSSSPPCPFFKTDLRYQGINVMNG